jgi:hypothetical protein
MDKLSLYTLSLPLACKFLSENGFPSEAEQVRASFPGKDGPSRRASKGFAVDILRSKGLFERFVSECWPNGATERGGKRLEKYQFEYEALKEQRAEEDEDEVGGASDRFAYEQDLRDYLANNPSIIEPGMSLWPASESESAVEFRVDGGRRIDILAKDRDGIAVVIELKVSGGHERVIGQALYYRGCVKERFGAQRVRIVIIAREITPELRVATSDLPDVELFEYRLSVSLTKVAEALSTAVTKAAHQPS